MFLNAVRELASQVRVLWNIEVGGGSVRLNIFQAVMVATPVLAMSAHAEPASTGGGEAFSGFYAGLDGRCCVTHA